MQSVEELELLDELEDEDVDVEINVEDEEEDVEEVQPNLPKCLSPR